MPAGIRGASLLNRLFDIDTVTCQSYVVAIGSGNKSHPALGIDYWSLTQVCASHVSNFYSNQTMQDASNAWYSVGHTCSEVLSSVM